MTYAELLEILASLVAEGKPIKTVASKAERGLTPEQITRDHEIEAELVAIKAQNAVFDRQHKREAEIAGQQVQARGETAQVSAFHDNREDAPFATMVDFLSAIGQVEINHIVNLRLTPLAIATGLGEATPSDGGFAAQKDFSQELLRRARESSVFYPSPYWLQPLSTRSAAGPFFPSSRKLRNRRRRTASWMRGPTRTLYAPGGRPIPPPTSESPPAPLPL